MESFQFLIHQHPTGTSAASIDIENYQESLPIKHGSLATGEKTTGVEWLIMVNCVKKWGVPDPRPRFFWESPNHD
jgi:hypothetical protein